MYGVSMVHLREGWGGAGLSATRAEELLDGVEDGVAVGDAVTFPLPAWKEERRWVKRLLAEAMAGEAKAVCVIHAAARWKTKRWPAERYAEVADWLIARKRCLVVLVGGIDQADQVSRMVERMRDRALRNVRPFRSRPAPMPSGWRVTSICVSSIS